MERTLIKKSFMGFEHRVAPLQNVFHRECPDADLNNDVLEIFCGLQNELVGKMMDGACAISQLRRSKDVVAEDLLCLLDTQWNLDPLLVSANCIKTYYKVSETTDKIDLSSPPEAFPTKRKTKSSSNVPKVNPASSNVKKSSARKSALKSKCDQSGKVVNTKTKNNSADQDICAKHPYKTPLPLLNKKSVLQIQKRPSVEMSGHDFSVEFFRTKYNLDICNVKGFPQSTAIVPIHKSESEANEKISMSESSNLKIPSLKESSELKFEIPMGFCQNPEKHTVRPRQDVPVTVPKSSKASMVDEHLTFWESSIKCVPPKENTKQKIKIPISSLDSEIDTFKIAGLKQDEYVTDEVSKQSSKAPTCKLKSKTKNKKLTRENVIKVFPCNEKTESEFKVPTLVHLDSEVHTFRIAEPANFSENSSDTYLCKPKSNVKDKILTYEHSTGFSLKEKVKPDFKLAKQSSIEMLCPDSQVSKIPKKKGKQTISGVKCASVKYLEEARLPIVEMSHSGSDGCKISLKRRKQKVLGADVPIETPEEARRRLAIVLLRIAGKY